MKPFYFWNLLVVATVTVLAAGCTVPRGRLQITAMTHESLKSNPEVYKRVEIVPIWFTSSAYCYSSLTRSELMQIASTAGEKTAALLAETFTNRGYLVVGNVRALCCEDDLAAFDDDTRRLLDEVRVEFWSLTESVRAAAATGVPGLPFRYKLKAPLLQLHRKLGGSQANVLALVDSTVFVETPTGHGKRVLWNWTGAPLITTADAVKALVDGKADAGLPGVTVALGSPAAIEHTIALVDLHTQDVLLWTSVLTPGANVRESVDLRVTVFDLLSALPLIEPVADRQ